MGGDIQVVMEHGEHQLGCVICGKPLEEWAETERHSVSDHIRHGFSHMWAALGVGDEPERDPDHCTHAHCQEE